MPARLTHWIPYDAPGGRTALALCGARVDRRTSARDPTCPVCREQLARLEELRF